ncbi:amino acid adenylation domain-containing protein [Streptacidiphilus sp. EB103A]|uniref:amino acid adenylation domain-containing protein n=1 Tax=Streptacidiphilus sp. EB103A TaxID=3156275 RepID=UPI0035141FE4
MTGESTAGFVSDWAVRFGPLDAPSGPAPRQTGNTAAEPDYERRVSALEWVFLGLEPNCSVINFVVEGHGGLDPEVLREAVAVASAANPGSRLIRQDMRWVDSGVTPEVRAVEGGPFLRADLDSPELRRPLPDSGPTCEVLLVPDDPATVVFRAAHAVMDGRGLLHWVLDVFRVMRGIPPLGSDNTVNSDELLRQICAPQEPPAAADPPTGDCPSPVGPRAAEASGLLWRRRTVDGVHPAATAKVAAALAARYGSGRFAVPVDLRRHAPGLRSTALLSQPLQLDVTAGAGWEEIHGRMLTALADREELTGGVDPAVLSLPLTLLRAGIADLDRKAGLDDRYSGRAIVSHLGAVDLADLSADSFQASAFYPLGGANPGSPPEINLAETSGLTEITLTWFQGPGVAELADEVLDVIEEALSPRSRREWAGNRTERALPSELSVVELFRHQVERTPDRVALSGPEGDVSYAELSRRADAVAARLRSRGIGPGSVVGLLAGRTVAAFAGLWGVLRTGACYLPLDVRHPDHRLATLLATSGSSHCLVERPHEQRDFAPDGCTPVLLDDLAAADAPADIADAVISPADLAYIIFTSGSTGQPKGVQIEHHSIANYAHWGIRAFEFDQNTRLPLLAALSFDLSKTSVFLPLLVGGRVVLMRDEPDHVSLRWLLRESGANTLTLTPSHLDLISRLDLRPAEDFRSVVVVGEQLRTDVALRAQEKFGPECRVVNLYGPTEVTVGCTSHLFDAERDSAAAAVPIGLPGDNTKVFLLDAERRFVTPGEVGEMYLGGDQVARGYLGRPEFDRDRFPVLADGTRVYRTGDLARLLPSGELEFIGRADDQVKVRGFRVEPAEVAQALESHDRVDRAVVVAASRRRQTGKALYAYVVTPHPVAAEELEQYLAGLLPVYMLPSAIVAVPELPYTVNGKVDAAALPDPFAGDAPARPAARAETAVDAVEDAIAQIWARSLGVERSRLDGQANFHRLGGDSLALLAMLAGISREVLVETAEGALMAQLPSILREPTLEHVAAVAREAGTLL